MGTMKKKPKMQPAGIYFQGWAVTGETMIHICEAAKGYGTCTVSAKLDKFGRPMIVVRSALMTERDAGISR